MSSYYCCPHGITATLFYSKNLFRETLKKTYGYKITPNFNNLNPDAKTKKNNIIKIFREKKIFLMKTLKNLQVMRKKLLVIY